jgi:hypothetical protein
MGDMRARTIIVVLAAVTLGVGAWFLLRPSTEAPPSSPFPREATEILHPRVPAPEPMTEDDEVPETTAPPVDLQAADRDHDLFGVVMNASEVPVAGARIETTHYPWRGASTLDVESSWIVEAGPWTRTAEDGTFSVRLDRGQIVDLRVRSKGYATTVIPGCQAGEMVRAILVEGVNLEVLARDEEGSPVPGVDLDLWRLEDPSSGGPRYDKREGTTDSEGRYLFSELWPGHAMLGSSGVQMIELPESGTLTLSVTVPAGRTIQGRVTDADTTLPIPGTRVGKGWVLDSPVTTDEEGRYEYPGWTGRGLRDLHVVAEGYGREGKDVPPEGDLDFALHRGYEATGRVVDTVDNPVARALVSAVASRWAAVRQEIDTRSTLTGTDGEFTLTSLRRDFSSHTLVIQASGHGRLVTAIRLERSEDDSIDLGTLVLPQARWIEGSVLDSTYSPLSRVTVTLHGPGLRAAGRLDRSAGYGREMRRRTDDLGRFRFPDLSPGTYFLAIKMKGRPEVTRDVVVPEDRDLLDVEIVIDLGRAIFVTVCDASGSPVAGAYVRTSWGLKSAKAKTDAEGRALVEGLPGSEIHVQVHPPDRSFLAPPIQGVTPAGQEVRFVLEKAAWVEGQVIGPDGEGLPGMQLQAVVQGARSPLMVTCDETGSFILSCREGETVDLEVPGTRRVEGHREATTFRGALRGIVAPASGLRILLREIPMDRSLSVLVQGPDGTPAPGITVTLGGAGVPSDAEMLTTDEQGRVSVAGLTAETVRVVALRPQTSAFPEDTLAFEAVTLVPDNQEMILRFRRGVFITGVLLDPEGRPVEGAIVVAVCNPEMSGWGRSDEGGRFRIAVPPDQTWTLQVMRHLSLTDGTYLSGKIDGVTELDGDVTLRLSVLQ